MEIRFVADSMLGRLAKWLKVMGYDTHYQSSYRRDEIGQLVHGGRRLLSRHAQTTERYANALLIRSEHVREQLREMNKGGNLRVDRSKWFTRCLICNVPLRDVKASDAGANVPEYVLYENITGIRSCPSCERHFWPGSHRTRMMRQLKEWDF